VSGPALLRRAAAAAAALACLFCFVAALRVTQDHYPATPDTLHHGVVARNLVRGNGFRINMIQYHVGHYDGVEHVAEMHGILQPVALAGLFALFGPERSLFRVPGFAYVALAGWAAFLWARRGFGSAAGLAAALLTLASPLLWFWAWYGEDDAGFAFWFLLALFSLDVAIEKPSRAGFALAGLVAGAALLQKLSALILLAPMLAIPMLRRDTALRMRLAWCALWLAPWLLVLLLYLARNFASSGSPMFRFGAIDWIYKSQGLEGFFAVYDEMPSLGDVLRSLGPSRVGAIVLRQLGEFARATLSVGPLTGIDIHDRVMAPACLSLLGVAALALHARRAPRLAALAALSIAAAAALLCGVWHFEVRFLTMLVPLLAVSLAGALATAARALPGRAAAALAGAFGLTLVVSSWWILVRSLALVPTIVVAMDACPTALEWIRRETLPGDRILTFDPWTTSWATERGSVVVPSGVRGDVEKIVARYRPAWLFVPPAFERPLSRLNLRLMVENPTPGFAATPAFADGNCAIYRISAGALTR
jgi:hypothetical protein